MGTYGKDGKYPEQIKPLVESQCMKDNSFLLMQQCLRDARQLQRMTEHFDDNGDGPYINDWDDYERNIVTIAQSLFTARLQSPMNFDDMKQLLMAVDTTVQDKQECLAVNKELTELTTNLNKTYRDLADVEKDIEKEKTTQINMRSQNFLLSVVGSEMFNDLQNNGYIDVKGRFHRVSAN